MPLTVRQAVLLVGGRGTRMWPLTAAVPKGLLPVAGVRFLDLQVDQLRAVGIEEVFLAVGRAQLDAWKAYAAEREGVHLVVEDEPLDTAGPVRAVLDRLDDTFFVLNGDVIMEADLVGFLDRVDGGASGTLGLVEVADTSPYGVVVLDDVGRVERFVEKPPAAEAPASTVNAGMYVMTRRALAGFAPGPLSFERVVFPSLAADGDLAGVVIAGRWLDIGTPDLYLDCTGAFLRGDSTLYRGTEAFLVEGECSGETSGSWCWVGAGAAVHTGAVIEDSVVLPGATIGPGAVVRSAIIGWDASVDGGAMITGGTIVGPGASIGAGCELTGGMRVAPGARLEPGAVTFSPPE